LAHPTRFERVTFAFGGRVSDFASICKHLQSCKNPSFFSRLSMDAVADLC
jgi:hypothetical protein